MYLLEYRFLPANPDEVMPAGGMKMEDGYITQWGSTGQPYLLLLRDENDDWTRICVTNTDIIEQAIRMVYMTEDRCFLISVL
jgi:hypothetical protein